MIYYLVVPLLWACPALHLPVFGTRQLPVPAPARAFVCEPTAGIPERFNAWFDAEARIEELGSGASVSACQPDGSCRPISISWTQKPTFGGVPQ